MFGAMRRAFPDLHVEVEHVMATDNEIAFAYTITGTHLGELMGHAPTGRTVSYRGMQISRFEDGKMVERWGAATNSACCASSASSPDPSPVGKPRPPEAVDTVPVS